LKIINVDDKPFEWTYGGEIFGPLAPGQVADFPDTVALHAIKRGVVLDGEGDFVKHRVEALDSVGRDRIKEIAMYECPFALTNQCDAKPFKNAVDLKAHLESHWELSPEPAAIPKQPVMSQAARK
jgi:hypothetical protein